MKLTKEIVRRNNLIDENGHCIIPDCYTKIGGWAFENCTSLKSINIPNSILKIGNGAFWNCTNLESIELPNSITKIVRSVFSKCISLESIRLPNNITKIEEYAFYYCTNLKVINLPDSVENIGNHSFCDCTSLTSINLPNSITEIKEYAFSCCTSLPKLEVGKEILEAALNDNYFEQFGGLCLCFRKIVSELMLKYRKPICLEVELPMFTVENAIKYANGRNSHLWFENNSDRKKFIKHMLSEISKNDFNDEILILRR